MGSVTGGGHGRAPRGRGADVVVRDMSEVGIRPASRRASDVPSLFEVWGQVAPRLREATVALLLDFDGTLSPIVGEPDAADLPRATRDVLRELAPRCSVAVISGRDLRDVRRRVGLDGLWYAGSHGFELSGPGGFYWEHERARDAVPALVEAERRLRGQLADIPGVVVERKR